MIEPRSVVLEHEAVLALTQILGIMGDQLMADGLESQWNFEHIIELEARLMTPAPGEAVTLGIDDAALLLQGMAFTEVMSIDFPWPLVAAMAKEQGRVVLRCTPYETFATPPRHLHSNDQDEKVTHWLSGSVPWDATDPK